MVNLGVLHEQGNGVQESDVLAVGWYRKAAIAGNRAGVHSLAAMLDRGKGVNAPDSESAAELVLRSLDMGNEYTYKQLIDNSRVWTRDFRRAFPRRLRDAGYYSGSADGEFGGGTQAAIERYWTRNR